MIYGYFSIIGAKDGPKHEKGGEVIDSMTVKKHEISTIFMKPIKLQSIESSFNKK